MSVVQGILVLLVVVLLALMVVGILGRLLLAVFKPGWSTFVNTWQRTMPTRSTIDIPAEGHLLMRACYKR